MSVKITNVQKGSIGYKYKIKKDDIIISAENNVVNDMLDYDFHTACKLLHLKINSNGVIKNLIIKKDEYEPLGLEFETYLMDKKHSCKNKCIFCFIDQLPKGMRENLYFKDDDERLSFLYGNYITLTNLTQQELDRIIKLHISPINISVHTTNPKLRIKMMKNKDAGDVLKYLKIFTEAGIKINAQIVLCRNYNDGDELVRTLQDLTNLTPNIQSVSVVPFGKTRYREKLCQIEPFDTATAKQTIEIIDNFAKKMYNKYNTNIVHAGDEFYLLAESEIPSAERYDAYLQLENGVGMLRTFMDTFEERFNEIDAKIVDKSVDIATGEIAYSTIYIYAQKLMSKFKNLKIKVHSIKNNFFGGNVSVTGLVTGKDLVEQLKGNLTSNTLIISQSMLNDEEDFFIDDFSVEKLKEELSIKLLVSPQSGDGFVDTILNA